HDGLARKTQGEDLRRLDHGVGAVRDHDLRLRRLAAGLEDHAAIGVAHVETVDHHHRAHGEVEMTAPELQHLVEVGVAEEELAAELVVLLVEGPAGHQHPDRHGGKPNTRARWKTAPQRAQEWAGAGAPAARVTAASRKVAHAASAE